MAFDFNTAALGDALAWLSTSFPVSSIITVRTGSAPGVGNSATGSVLWTYTLGASPWASVSSTSRSLASVPLTANASGTGTAGYGRLVSADTTRTIEFTVGTSGTDAIFDSVSWTSGQSVSLNSLTVNAADNQP